MGAGVQRWWRDYERECAESDTPSVLTNAITEDGISIRVRLYLTKPMWYGVIDLTDGTKHKVS